MRRFQRRTALGVLALAGVAASIERVACLRCGIVGADGRTRAEHGMVGEIAVE